jgi:hypothetical protein
VEEERGASRSLQRRGGTAAVEQGLGQEAGGGACEREGPGFVLELGTWALGRSLLEGWRRGQGSGGEVVAARADIHRN